MATRSTSMKAIDVEDLPEPVAQALQVVVRTLRAQFRAAEKPRERVELRTWPGRPIGTMSREEIHEDVG
jgi:hypothetical protein